MLSGQAPMSGPAADSGLCAVCQLHRSSSAAAPSAPVDSMPTGSASKSLGLSGGRMDLVDSKEGVATPWASGSGDHMGSVTLGSRQLNRPHESDVLGLPATSSVRSILCLGCTDVRRTQRPEGTVSSRGSRYRLRCNRHRHGPRESQDPSARAQARGMWCREHRSPVAQAETLAMQHPWRKAGCNITPALNPPRMGTRPAFQNPCSVM